MKKIVLFLLCSPLLLIAQNDLIMRYDAPARNWNEALPIGNGKIGAMVYGGVDKEEIQLNEETIWAGEPGNNVYKGSFSTIQEIRKRLAEGKPKEAQNLANNAFPQSAPQGINYGMPYQTMGSLHLDFEPTKAPKNYQRNLNISNAITQISYTVEGVTYQREAFTPLTQPGMLIKLSASQKGKISLKASLKTPHKNTKTWVDKGLIHLSGISSDFEGKQGKVRFKTLVKPQLKGGKLLINGDSFEIQNADEVVLWVTIATNFVNFQSVSGNEITKAEEQLKNLAKYTYETLKNQHIAQYQTYFNRVNLDLGKTQQSNKTIPVRLQELSTNFDPELITLYFQFGRYLLISSSMPGTQAANLQGIWNPHLTPPWDSKYTININTEMNYWPAEVTQLSEMHQPLFSLLEDLEKTGKETAKEMYNARGWVAHHNTDIWRISGLVDGGFYGLWPMGGAWLTQHLWQHYLYNGDTNFLKKYYPLLKGKVEFFLDVLQNDKSGKYKVVSPSMSPENDYLPGVSLSAGTTMDNQLLRDVFHNFIQAAHILKTDKTLVDTVQKVLKQIPPMFIGQHTQLQEWLEDLDKTDDQHRHISHLYGLYPSGQLSPFRTPKLIEAAKNTMVYRGDVSTGWSMGWKVNWWARLLDGNQTYKLIVDQLSPAPIDNSGRSGGTYPNLLDAHPPFQIDGNFGCTSGMAEMLVQSYDGFIYLLPALPHALASGKVSGLKARGGFVIDIEWENHRIKKLKVYSELGGNCRIRWNKGNNLKGNLALKVANGDNPNPFYTVWDTPEAIISSKAQLKGIQVPEVETFDFETTKGKTYEFTAL